MKKLSVRIFLMPWCIVLGFVSMMMIPACSESTEYHVNNEPQTNVNTMSGVENPWWKSAVIYEVNVRQYTPEGTFASFKKHLTRLRDLGIDILWFMPIHPISETKRKGSLGSYYAISDYRGINPDFGTLVEWKDLIDEIHDMGMYVVMDWVANHTGFDHVWTKEFPRFYVHDKEGNIAIPHDLEGNLTDWTDVAELDYNNQKMRDAMISEMEYWVRESGVDGYRCDVAFMVPDDFWVLCRLALEKHKPDIFMLAESEHPNNRNDGSFEATYGWELLHLMNDIGQSKKEITKISAWYENQKKFDRGFQMSFTTNHDENSWAGTALERLGNASKAMSVLTFTLPGMPLIYSGQEANLDHRLKFFEKDSIDWGDFEKTEFFKTLIDLKHGNPALWNGQFAGEITFFNTSNPNVLAFLRKKGSNKILVIVNANNLATIASLDAKELATSNFIDLFDKEKIEHKFSQNQEFTIPAWGFKIFTTP